MLTDRLDALNLLTTPVWVVSPDTEELLFTNAAAKKLTAERSVRELRTGTYSAYAQHSLAMYLPGLRGEQNDVAP
ncbi:hypothetical protein POH93_14950 [Phytobacter diazotrophicus]|uniref:hypothetical protein n=1 Tax=Phytobacter diazotrophicus TaxID=395631 RepID=UPI00232E4F87|nr:hypothetical protein [Phytobacter diazotrophicus]MDC0726682.1 hypothetical protein [Phytobacter diazotrophicus]MDC0734149.1 hypothetical protein [Phytobacter diazotrophicus]